MIMRREGTLPGRKEVYTTAEAAKLCRVHKNTVIAAINRGLLRSMKTPGGHNRVAQHDLLAYMRRSGIVAPEWADPPPTQVLVVGEAPHVREQLARVLTMPRYELQHCTGLFEAGRVSTSTSPAIVIVDAELGDAGWGDSPGADGPALIGLRDGDGEAGATGVFDAVLGRAALDTIESRIAALV